MFEKYSKILLTVILLILIIIIVILIILFSHNNKNKGWNCNNYKCDEVNSDPKYTSLNDCTNNCKPPPPPPPPPPSPSPSSIEKMFNNLSNEVGNIGGLLVSTFDINTAKEANINGGIVLSDMVNTGCSPIRKTCIALTYLRKDFLPILYTSPGKDSPKVGLILDINKIWSYITVMGLVDSDTDQRTCCTNQQGYSVIYKNPNNNPPDPMSSCTNEILNYQYPNSNKYNNYVVYGLPSTGANCKSFCDIDDYNCQSINAGGTFTLWGFPTNLWCNQFNNCVEYKEKNINDVPQDIKNQFTEAKGFLELKFKENCDICTKPFLCISDNPPNPPNSESTPTNSPFAFIEKDIISTYIGKNGEYYQKAILDSGGNVRDYSQTNIAVNSCRFQKKDWDVFVKVYKDFYNMMLYQMYPDNNMINNLGSGNLNVYQGNPTNNVFLENEINMYAYTTSDDYNKENQIFQDSILGLFYIYNTCEDQLDKLKTVETQLNNGTIFKNNIDRCNAYFNMTTEDRKNYELNQINTAKQTMIDLSKTMSAKLNRNIPLFEATPFSNCFYDYNIIKTMLNGDNKFNDLFKIVDYL